MPHLSLLMAFLCILLLPVLHRVLFAPSLLLIAFLLIPLLLQLVPSPPLLNLLLLQEVSLDEIVDLVRLDDEENAILAVGVGCRDLMATRRARGESAHRQFSATGDTA
jgi:hypothetical protein